LDAVQNFLRSKVVPRDRHLGLIFNEDYLLFKHVITLRAKHSGAVYCNRSCLAEGRADGGRMKHNVFVAGGRVGGVCYHDNSKLRASIFTKLGL